MYLISLSQTDSNKNKRKFLDLFVFSTNMFATVLLSTFVAVLSIVRVVTFHTPGSSGQKVWAEKFTYG